MARKGKGLSFKQFSWVLFFAAVATFFVLDFSKRFALNCVCEWPPRWDLAACWNEQIEPAKHKAFEDASPLMPEIKVKMRVP